MASNSNDIAGPLCDALTDFKRALTPEQRAHLQALHVVPDAAAVITFTKQVDDENAKRKSRCVASRLCSVLESVQQFSTVVETFITSHPEIAALVWGSIKFAILLTLGKFASRFSTYFDKLSSVFMNMRNNCPRYMEYQTIYADSKRLQAALCNYYATVVRLCQKMVEVGQRQGLQQLTMALWRPFETEFGAIQEELQRQNEEVKDEISLASRQTAERERQLQVLERKKASRYWKQGDLYHQEGHRWRVQVDQQKSRSKRQRLLEELSNYNYMLSFKQARKKRHWSTSSWLLETDDYKDWLAGELALFWCSGLLGTGKTVLTAGVIDDLFLRGASVGVQVAFFFCQFDNAASLTARTILGSLARQCLNSENMTTAAEAHLAELFEHGLPDLGDLEAFFVDRVVESRCRFIVIDGIDECTKTERNFLFAALRKVADRSPGSFKIFIASRPQVGLDIDKFFRLHHQKLMDTPGVHGDIAKYIKHVLKEKLDSGDLKVGNPNLTAEIEDVLVSGAQGMYLLVVFQIREICDQINDDNIRAVLKGLPKSLPEWYERILDRIVDMGKEEIARKTFRWVAAAKRPLVLGELREAIAIEPCQAYRKLECLANDINQVVFWCGDLICIDEEELVVQFAHPTVKQFFLSEPSNPRLAKLHFQLPDIDHEAGEICVTYLNFNDFKTQLIKASNARPLDGQAVIQASLSMSLGKGMAEAVSKLKRTQKIQSGVDSNLSRQLQDIAGLTDRRFSRKLQSSYPFLAYAREWWLLHTMHFTKEGSKTWILWKTLLFSESVALLPWAPREWDCMPHDVVKWAMEHDHGGLLQLTMGYILLDQRRDLLVRSAAIGRLNIASVLINSLPRQALVLSAAMSAAAEGGHLDIVERLLDSGVDASAEHLGRSGWSAIQTASRYGHIEVVERLVDAGAMINAKPSPFGGRTALQAASGGGHLRVVQSLLGMGANINAEPAGDSGRTALQAASEGGHLEVVERLLSAKADVNAEPALEYGRTALQAASGDGHLEVVERLLSEKASVNAAPAIRGGRTALQAASGGGHLEIVERLLSANANVNSWPALEYGRTALQAASWGGHFEVVERLLSAKADVNAEPAIRDGRTALQAASEGGHLEVVERLLSAKADVNAWPATRRGRTALQAASGGGHLEVVERLLSAKADVNAWLVTKRGRTALQAASGGGHLEVVERLLSAKADVNAEPAIEDGRTALQAASEGGHLEVVERLLSAKANVNAWPATECGRTALQAASGGGHLEVVERLLSAKADANAESATERGWTALQAASGGGHLEVVERLLSAKADVNAEPAIRDGRTALQAASGGGHLEVVERLLSAKADVNAESAIQDGRTALQAASEGRHLDVVERLKAAGARLWGFA